jgi:hypothetical protein
LKGKKNRIRESFILDISETLQDQQFSWKNCQRTGGQEGSFLNFSKMAILYENWFFVFSPLPGKGVIPRLITDQYSI